MKKTDRKILISTVSAAAILIALLWVSFRLLTGTIGPGVPSYQIGRDSNWIPLDLRGKERNMVGFSNDLIAVISQEKNFRANVFEVGPHALFDGLNVGNYDAVFSSLDPSVTNRKRYLFSDPYYRIGPVLVVPISSEVDNLAEMKGKILGIESGALQIFNIPEPADVLIIPYENAAQALDNLDKNVIDGVYLDALRAHVFTQGFYLGRLKVATSPLTDKGLRLVARNEPQSENLILQFNEGLAEIKEQGIYRQLIEKWNLIDTEVEQSQETP